MHPSVDHQLLSIWEEGQGVDATRRALILLAAAGGEAAPNRLAQLAVGERDTRLLEWRQVVFGDQAAATAECTSCGHATRFAIALEDVLAMALPAEQRDGDLATFEFEVESFRLHCRLPDSRALARATATGEVGRARESLIESTVLSAEIDGRRVPAGHLPARVVAALGEELEARDPMALVPIDLACSACGHRWLPHLDVAEFLWREVSSRAERLLADVQALALAYGWSEAEILAISPARRRFYLENGPGQTKPPEKDE